MSIGKLKNNGLKILGLLGSPRAGNSEAIFKAFAKGAEDGGASVQSIWLKAKNIAPCSACEACFKKGSCAIEDDFKEIAKAIDESNVLVFVTPVHFGGPSAYMTTFFSRCQSFWARKYVLEKRKRAHSKNKGIGILIVTSYENNPRYVECVKRIARYVFNTLDFEPKAALWFSSLDKPNEASSNPKILKEASEAGSFVAQGDWSKLKW